MNTISGIDSHVRKLESLGCETFRLEIVKWNSVMAEIKLLQQSIIQEAIDSVAANNDSQDEYVRRLKVYADELEKE